MLSSIRLRPSEARASARQRPPLGHCLGLGLALCAGLFATACDGRGDPSHGPDASGLVPTWCDDIQPLVETRCLGCHSVTRTGSQRFGAPPGVSFDTYEDATPFAPTMDYLIQAGIMPPSGPLPAVEQETFKAWVNTGLSRGDCP